MVVVAVGQVVATFCTCRARDIDALAIFNRQLGGIHLLKLDASRTAATLADTLLVELPGKELQTVERICTIGSNPVPPVGFPKRLILAVVDHLARVAELRQFAW